MGESQQPPHSDPRAARAVRTQRLWLWGLIAAAAALLLVTTVGLLWLERAQELDDAAEQTQRHADRLTGDLQRTLGLADLAIAQDLRRPHGSSAAEAPADVVPTDRAEILGALLLPFSLHAQSGDLQAPPAGPHWSSVADDLRAPAGAPVIALRRVAPPNGLGIAAYTLHLPLTELVNRFDHVRAESQGGVALFSVDAASSTVTVLARAPFAASEVGLRVQGPLVQALKLAPHGVFDDVTQIDGQRRIVGYRRVEQSNLVVGYGLAHRAVLAHWQAWLAPTAAVTAALLSLFLLGGWRLDRLQRQAAAHTNALRRSEAQFRALADNLPDVLVRLDREGRYLYANPSIELASGLAPSAYIGKTNAELGMAPAAVDLWMATLDRVLRSAQPARMEFRYAGPAGLRDWESLVMPVPGASGPAETALVISRDVTERCRAEDALRHSELRFRLAATSGQVWDWDIQSNRFDVPPKFWRTLGCEAPPAPSAIDAIAHIHPRDRDAWLVAVRAHFKRREPFDVTARFVSVTGDVRWIHARGQALWNAEGRAVYMAGTAFDVTTRRRLEDELRASEARLQDLLANSPAVIYTQDVAGDHPVTYCSENVRDLLGYEAASFTGGREFWKSHLHPDDLARAVKQVDSVPSRGSGVFEYRFRHRAGHWCWIRDHMRLLRDGQGQPLQMIGSLIDISARREAEDEVRRLNADLEARVRERTAALDNNLARLQQVNRELSASNHELEAFTYSVSHDLREPLRAVDGLAALLAQHDGAALSAEGARLLGRLRDSAKRMDTLIHDLLLFARTAREPIRRTQVPVTTLVRHCLDECRTEIAARHIDIQVADLPPAHADPGLLRQVLANLISNAVKYTRLQAAPRIEVGVQVEGAETRYFVRDNGAGFDMAHVDKLFGVFQRLHLASEFEGTGAGLAIVQRIIERHGGRVWAEAKPQAGATFYFTIGSDL